MVAKACKECEPCDWLSVAPYLLIDPKRTNAMKTKSERLDYEKILKCKVFK